MTFTNNEDKVIFEKITEVLEKSERFHLDFTNDSFTRWTSKDGWSLDLHSDFFWIDSSFIITSFDYKNVDYISENNIIIDLETILYL